MHMHIIRHWLYQTKGTVSSDFNIIGTVLFSSTIIGHKSGTIAQW